MTWVWWLLRQKHRLLLQPRLAFELLQELLQPHPDFEGWLIVPGTSQMHERRTYQLL